MARAPRISRALSLLATAFLCPLVPWAATEVNVTNVAGYQGATSMVADPRDPSRLAVAVRDGSAAAPWVYFSASTGATWSQSSLPLSYQGHAYGEGSQTSLAVDDEGTWFAAYIVDDPVTGNPTDTTVAVARSFNGLLWDAAGSPAVQCCTGAASPLLREPAVAVDSLGCGSSYPGRLYVAWVRKAGTDSAIYVAASNDGGNTWGSPVKVNDGATGTEQLIRPRLAVGPGGVLYVAWLDGARKRLYVDISSDGGASFGADRSATTVNLGCGAGDCGTALSCSGASLHGSTPEFAVDGSWSARRGWLYLTYADDLGTGNGMDIFWLRSTNGGTTWTAPARLNADAAGTGRHQYGPGLSMGLSDGSIHAAWYDRRGDVGNCATHVYGVKSADGGTTWGAEERITSAATPTYAGTPGEGAHLAAAAVDAGGWFAWSDGRSGVFDAYAGFRALPAGRRVSGAILTDTVWSAANGPYYLTGDVTVETGVKLTVQGGTTLIAGSCDDRSSGADGSRVELIVKGVLDAQGTSGSPVSFQAAPGAISGSWYGLRFTSTSDSSQTRLAYTTVDRASYAVDLEGCSPTLDHVTLTNPSVSGVTGSTNSAAPFSPNALTVSGSTGQALSMGGGSGGTWTDLLVENCNGGAGRLLGGSTALRLVRAVVRNNPGGGLTVDTSGGTAEVVHSDFTGNSGDGLHLSGSGPRTAAACNFTGNAGFGLVLENGSSFWPGGGITWNNFSGNTTGALSVAPYSLPADARRNYWGGATTTEMGAEGYPSEIAAIRDIQDDPSLRHADYQLWEGAVVSTVADLETRLVVPSTVPQLQLRIAGAAIASAGVKRVQVSVDGGATWDNATVAGSAFYYDWFPAAPGPYTLLSRVTDMLDQVEAVPDSRAITVTSAPTTSGSLVGDENWSGALTLRGDIYIPSGLTLSIAAGTQVRALPRVDQTFSGLDPSRIEIIVAGNLLVDGIPASRATFDSSRPVPLAGDWYGIRFLDSCSDTLSHLTSADVDHGVNGLKLEQAAPDFVDARVRWSSQNGISGDSGALSKPLWRISGCTLTNNGAAGIDLTAGTAVEAFDDVASANVGSGVVIRASGHAVALRNLTSTGNGGAGVALESGSTGVTLTGGTLSNNGGEGVRVGSGGTEVRVDSVTIQNNLGPGVEVNYAGQCTLMACTLTGNRRGIQTGSPRVVAVYNTLTANADPADQGSGFRSDAAEGTPSVLGMNTFDDPGAFEAYLEHTGGDAPGRAVNARRNWWGSATTADMNAKGYPADVSRLYDIRDDRDSGLVDYRNWLASAPAAPGVRAAHITYPATGSSLNRRNLVLTGVAYAAAGIDRVEVSTDNGSTWGVATGEEAWSYDWFPPSAATYSLKVRVVDTNLVASTPSETVSVTITQTGPTTSGPLVADEVWGPGTVLLQGDVIVGAGRTLTLQPGTSVKAEALTDDRLAGDDASRIEVVVRGTLVATGTAGSHIGFTSDATTPTSRDWYGLRFEDSANDLASSLAYADITAAWHGVEFEDAGPALSEVTSTGNHRHGLYAHHNSGGTFPLAVSVTGGSLSSNGGRGVDLWAEGAVPLSFQGTTFEQNGWEGMSLGWSGGDAPLTLDDLSVLSNGRTGITLATYYGGMFTPLRMKGCTVADNIGLGANLRGESAEIFGNLFMNQPLPYQPALEVVYAQNLSLYKNTFTGNGINLRVDGPVANATAVYNDFGPTSGDAPQAGTTFSSGGGGSVPRLHYNNLGDAASGTILETDSGYGINAWGNYWGAATTLEMQVAGYPADISTLRDIEEDAWRGRIDYSRFRTSAVVLSPTRLSNFLNPQDGATLTGRSFVLQGSAGADAGVGSVQVSTDGGATWNPATGGATWNYLWSPASGGAYTLQCRVVDKLGGVQAPATSISVTVNLVSVTTTGTLAGDENWSGVIVLTGDVTVPVGVTLTLEPGVEVRSTPNTDDTFGGADSSRIELIVQGRLAATGTVATPITLTSDAGTPSPGDWYGIRYESSADSTTGLSYVTVTHARRAISSRSTSGNSQDAYPDLSHCTVRFASERAIDLTPAAGMSTNPAKASFTVADCTVEDSPMGISIEYYAYQPSWETVSFHLLRNNVTRCGSSSYGIAFTGGPTGYYGFREAKRVEISGNSLTDCPDGGIRISSWNWIAKIQDLAVEDNTLLNCGRALSNSAGIETGYVSVTGGTIARNTVTGGHHGFALSPPVEVTLAENVLSGGSGYGLAPGHGAVVRNAVTGYTSHGIWLQDGWIYGETFGTKPGDVLLYNEVTGNGGAGIYSNPGIAAALPQAHYCTLTGNTAGAVRLGSPSAFDARSNWWGAVTTAEMAGKGYPADIAAIYDIEDDGALGRVDYGGWLGAAPGAPEALESGFVWPRGGETVSMRSLRLEGYAYADAGLDRVELSTDGGASWVPATGTSAWTFTFTPFSAGPLTVLCRAVAVGGAVETPATAVSITVDAGAPTTTGALSQDETWSGVITLTGDVTVPAGITLTLLPGTLVRSLPLCDDQHGGLDTSRIELIISGRLNATGTALAGVVLTSASVSPLPGQWYGLRYTSTADSTAALTRVTVEYARKGVYAKDQDAYPDLLTCTLRYLSEEAAVFMVPTSGTVAAPAKGTFTISNCTVTSCGGGIFVNPQPQWGWEAFTYQFTNNTFTSTGALAPAFAFRPSGTFPLAGLQVTGNTFTSCAAGSVDLSPAWNYPSIETFALDGNTISGGGVAFNLGNLGVVSGTFRDNAVTGGSDGFVGSPGQVLRAERNTFLNGSGTGITFGHGQLLRTRVQGYGADGVRFANAWPFGHSFGSQAGDLIAFCDIQDNQGNGIVDASGTSEWSAMVPTGRAHFSNLLNNVGDALRADSVSPVDARRNWWGAAMTAEMVAKGYPANIGKLRDVEDDGTKGRVDYQLWRSGAVTTGVTLQSYFVWPSAGLTLSQSTHTLEGVAYATAGIDRVEISTDNGTTWTPALGTYRWSFSWSPSSAGSYTLKCRVIAVGGAVENPGDSIAVTVSGTAPTTSGVLSRDENWSGTVTLTGDITIPSGRTLTLAAGTQVRCQPWSDDRHGGIDPSRIEIIVEGRLVSNGTPASPTAVTTASASPARGQWYGVRYMGTAPSAQTLSRCDLSWGVRGVSTPRDGTGGIYPDLLYCRIDQMSRRGIDLRAQPTSAKAAWRIAGTTVTNTTEEGIALEFADPSSAPLKLTVEDNQVNGFGTGSGGVGGIGLWQSASRDDMEFAFLRNTVSGTSVSYGIYASAPWWGAFRAATFQGNAVSTTQFSYPCVYLSNFHRMDATGNTVSGGSNGMEVRGWPGSPSDYFYLSGNKATGASNAGGYVVWANHTAGTPGVLLEDNSFTDNAGSGLWLDASTASSVLRRNNLYGNGAFALSNRGQAPATATGNYWGAATTSQMQSLGCDANITAIEDQRDNGGYGLVNYCNWAPGGFGDQAMVQLANLSGTHRLSWTPKAGITYDLVRGSTSNLSRSGGTVYLGAVVCIAQADGDGVIDLPAGSPPAGTCWFYVLRDHVTPGVYGYSSANEPQVPTSGGCP